VPISPKHPPPAIFRVHASPYLPTGLKGADGAAVVV
jgi:hypothetical protein